MTFIKTKDFLCKTLSKASSDYSINEDDYKLNFADNFAFKASKKVKFLKTQDLTFNKKFTYIKKNIFSRFSQNLVVIY